jgi:hypothetical protein
MTIGRNVIALWVSGAFCSCSIAVTGTARGPLTAMPPVACACIRPQKPIVDRQFEIEFLDPDAEVFALTFG